MSGLGEQSQPNNRPVWLGLATAIILVTGLTALFALEPWDRSVTSEPSVSDSKGSVDNAPEPAALPGDLCEFVGDTALDTLISARREVTPRSTSTMIGEEVSCDVAIRSGGLPYLTFTVERANSSYSHEDVMRKFRKDCAGLETPSDGRAERLPQTDRNNICGEIVHVPESNIIEMEVYAVDNKKDTISLNYTVTAATAAEAEEAAQDVLTFVDDLTKKLRE